MRKFSDKMIVGCIAIIAVGGLVYAWFLPRKQLQPKPLTEPQLLHDINGAPVFFNPEVPIKFMNELDTIYNAAVRNDCTGDDFLTLLAIRISENGGPGKQFGVKHPKAWNTDLDTQAGWAAATIVKNRERFGQKIRDTPLYDKNTDEIFTSEQFIYYLGNRYCPADSDPQGNTNWKDNVLYWYQKLGGDVGKE